MARDQKREARGHPAGSAGEVGWIGFFAEQYAVKEGRSDGSPRREPVGAVEKSA